MHNPGWKNKDPDHEIIRVCTWLGSGPSLSQCWNQWFRCLLLTGISQWAECPRSLLQPALWGLFILLHPLFYQESSFNNVGTDSKQEQFLFSTDISPRGQISLKVQKPLACQQFSLLLSSPTVAQIEANRILGQLKKKKKGAGEGRNEKYPIQCYHLVYVGSSHMSDSLA